MTLIIKYHVQSLDKITSFKGKLPDKGLPYKDFLKSIKITF